jgi:hypothetical protein
MTAAAGEGHKDLVQFFMDKGADNWDRAMAEASRGGHRDLVLFFIQKEANNMNCAMQTMSHK